MRLLIAGAGVTTPLVLGSFLSRAGDLGLEGVTVFDPRPDRLVAIEPVVRAMTARSPGPVVDLDADVDRVLRRPPDCAIVSIRPGLEAGRRLDEERAASVGYLANETVGAAGLAFACRAVPAAVALVARILTANPACVVVNFTNPAGVVTAALRASGAAAVYGVCSSAEKAARLLGRPRWQPLVYGLNHLSWTYALDSDGVDVLPEVLADPVLLASAQPWIDAGPPLEDGCLLNEYLPYYYRLDEVLARQHQAPTRGEVVERLNAGVRAEIAGAADDASAYRAYLRYVAVRKQTSGLVRAEELNDDDGYSGPAVSVVEGTVLLRPTRASVLTTDGPETGLPPGIATEVSVRFSDGRPTPVGRPALPERAWALLRAVASYEDGLREAIQGRDGDGLLHAMSLHPTTSDPAANVTYLRQTVADWPEVFADWRNLP